MGELADLTFAYYVSLFKYCNYTISLPPDTLAVMSALSWIPTSRRNWSPRGNTNAATFPDFEEFLDIICNQDWENNPLKNRETQDLPKLNISGKEGLNHTYSYKFKSYFCLCLQTAVSKKEDYQKDPHSHNSRFFKRLSYILCYRQLVKNTAVVKRPNSPVPISHIHLPEVVSHL